MARTFHARCFRCARCEVQLTPARYAEAEASILLTELLESDPKALTAELVQRLQRHAGGGSEVSATKGRVPVCDPPCREPRASAAASAAMGVEEDSSWCVLV